MGCRTLTTLYPKRLLLRQQLHGPKEDLRWLDEERPKKRGDCENGPRPCPWALCKYHLYLDVNPHTGTIRFNHPDKELWELEETCALDLTGEEQTLQRIGELLNVTRERARQIEMRGIEDLRLSPKLRGTTLVD